MVRKPRGTLRVLTAKANGAFSSRDACVCCYRRSLDQREPLAVVEHCRAAESLGIGLPLEGVNRDQVPRIHCRNQPLQVRDAGMAGRVDRDHGNAMRLDPILQVPEAHERSEEHTSELQSLMRISYAVF